MLPVKSIIINEVTTLESLNLLINQINFDDLDEFSTILCNAAKSGFINLKKLLLDIDWEEPESKENARWGNTLEQLFVHAFDATEDMYEVYCRIVSSSARYRADSAARTWIESNPQYAHELIKLFSLDEYSVGLLASCINTIRKIDTEVALDALIELTFFEGKQTRNRAISQLGEFKTEPLEKNDKVLLRLKDLLSSGSEQEVANAVSAFFRYDPNGQNKDLITLIETLFNTPPPEVYHSLIVSWSQNDGELKTRLLEQIKQLMKRLITTDKNSITVIDAALCNLNLYGDRQFILDIFEHLFVQNEITPNIKALHLTSTKLSDANDETIGWYSAQLLLTGRRELGEVAESLFPPLCQKHYDFNLEALELNSENLSFLVRKTFAHFLFLNGPAVSLLAACLKVSHESHTAKLAESIADFWLDNYPNDIELFEAWLTTETMLLNAINKFFRPIKLSTEAIKRLPTNKALQPSDMERRVQAEIASHRNREIQKKSMENSFFSIICQKSTVLYGNSFSTYPPKEFDQGIKPQTSPLHSHSWSVKMPRMAVFSPALLDYLVYTYKAEGNSNAVIN